MVMMQELGALLLELGLATLTLCMEQLHVWSLRHMIERSSLAAFFTFSTQCEF